MRTSPGTGLLRSSCGLGLLLAQAPLRAAETQDWDGGKMTKWVTPDWANNRVKITVTYEKKTDQIGQEVRFIEMIGPKSWMYAQRALIGGHGTIPPGEAQGKVEYDLTKDDLTNMRQGTVIGCFSCHGRQPPVLEEWPDSFNAVTDAEFKAFVLGIRNDGYEQYIDIATGPPSDTTDFKTRCFQSPEPAGPDLEVDFYFAHLNRGEPGFYALSVANVSMPGGWELHTDPALGMPYFLNTGQILYGEITIVPNGLVNQGDQANVTICTVDQDTLECPETFHVRAIADTQPPQITSGPCVMLVDQAGGPVARVTLTAADTPATVASARLLYSLDGAPQVSTFMSVESFDPDPVAFRADIGPLGTGTHTLTLRAQVRDELGNVVETDPQTTVLQVPRHFDVIYSRIPGHRTAQVPGVPGEEFTNIFRTFGSPGGDYWIFKGFTNAAASANDVIVVGSGLSGTVVAKEGDPSPVAGTNFSFMDLLCGVNDLGQYAFGTKLLGAPSTSDEVILTGNGLTRLVAVREGDPAPGLTDTPPSAAGDELFGNSLDSAHVLSNGTVAFAADGILNAASNNNSALYSGATVLAQEGTPIGGGAYSLFFAAGGNNFTMNDNSDWVVLADVNPAPGSQTALVVNGAVQINVGDSLPDVANPILTLSAPTLDANGDWIVQVATTDFAGFVVKNGAVVTAAGQPVEPGGTELFISPVTPTPPTFFTATGNGQGHVLVGGNTDNADTNLNQVLTLVDNRAVGRKGDLVDLNANGIVSDDDAKIGSFANNSAFITSNASVYFTGTLQTLAGASLGDALLRGASDCFDDSDCDDQLFCTGVEQCVNGACVSSGSPCAAGEACVESLDQCLPAIPGDADLDGDVDEADYRKWVNQFGQPLVSDGQSADFNGNGVVDAADYAVFQNHFNESY